MSPAFGWRSASALRSSRKTNSTGGFSQQAGLPFCYGIPPCSHKNRRKNLDYCAALLVGIVVLAQLLHSCGQSRIRKVTIFGVSQSFISESYADINGALGVSHPLYFFGSQSPGERNVIHDRLGRIYRKYTSLKIHGTGTEISERVGGYLDPRFRLHSVSRDSASIDEFSDYMRHSALLYDLENTFAESYREPSPQTLRLSLDLSLNGFQGSYSNANPPIPASNKPILGRFSGENKRER